MRQLLLLMLLAAMSPTALAGGPARDWRWSLEPGAAHAYTYRGTTDVTVKAPMGIGGDVSDTIIVETDFSLRPVRKLTDGRVEVEIPITRLAVANGPGAAVKQVDLPTELATMRAIMTPKGQFQFVERVMIESGSSGQVGVARVSQRGGVTTSQVSASAGGVEVSARATFDPATGRLTVAGGARESSAKPSEPAPATHQVDVLPAALLALLELPEHPVYPGAQHAWALLGGSAKVLGGPGRPCGPTWCGNLWLTAEVDASSLLPDISALGMPGLDEVGSMLSQLEGQMDMSGMFGMPKPAPAKRPVKAAKPTMRSTTEVGIVFDPDAGRLVQVQGTSGATVVMAGMDVRDVTRFTLDLVGAK